MFRLEFETSNAVFEDDPQGEIVRILRDIADRIEDGVGTGFAVQIIKDVNGNTIGSFQYFPETES